MTAADPAVTPPPRPSDPPSGDEGPTPPADVTSLVPAMSRRRFLGLGLVLAAGAAGATAMGRLVPVFGDEDPPSPIVASYDPSSAAWAFVVDTSRCIGCGLCVTACKEENHVPDEVAFNRTWVERHVVTTDGVVHVDAPDAGSHGFAGPATVPLASGVRIADAYFVPRLCMQCADSPCTTVCPVGATFQTSDGIILVDAERCIGCGYCVVACPYGARYIVPAGPELPAGQPGVADKCTWCYHRLARGMAPACVEVCPVGARVFGDAGDPTSEVARRIRRADPEPLWPEYGTRPRVLYAGPVTSEA